MAKRDLARQVANLEWYHTMDLPGGVVTPGMFDHRQVLERYGLPRDLSGMRVLDVATFDGFFAFEFERRGAAKVIATDLQERDELDWPVPLRRSQPDRYEPRRSGFDLAKEALGSRVEHLFISAYDVSPERIGRFDLVFVGSLLVHLRDPVGALMALYGVCEGTIMVAEPTLRLVSGLVRNRLAGRFLALDEFLAWWVPNRPCLKGWLEAAGFVDVTLGRAFTIPFRGRRGGIKHSVATARPLHVDTGQDPSVRRS